MRLGKTTILHFGTQVLTSVSGFAATFVIAYLLGAEGLGSYSIIVAIGFFWLGIPANAVSTAVRKRMSEGERVREYFSAGFAINVAGGVLLGALVLLASRVLQATLPQSEREFVAILSTHPLAIAGLVVGGVVLRSSMAGLDGQKRVAASGGLQAIERTGRTVLQVAVLLLGLGVAGLAFGHAVSLLVVGLAGLALVRVRPTIPPLSLVRDLLGFARYAWMGALRSRVFGWMDTIVLSFFVTASLIGIYEAAWGLASLLGMVSGSISRTLFPEVSDLSTDRNYERIKHYLDEGLVFAGVFVIPGLLGVAVIGGRVLAFYRPEFAKGAEILMILIAAYGADVYASQFVSVINAVDEPKVAYRINLAFVTINVVLNVVLVWQFGWYGAAVATAVASWFRAVGGYWSLRRIIGDLSVPTREIAFEVLAALLMVAVLVPLHGRAPSGRLWTLFLVLAGAGVYVTALLAVSTRVRTKATGLVPVL
ncbi:MULTISPECIES: oligosaccharide flippase family protein [Haloarcula]|uniref:Polysaccharide biosynthesis protein n=1 Tax=Haloarcula pellucida TaxID=1427151 RepID=A0A830GI89_9EURY|nr:MULTISPECIES: oligosaccharide flippase family protein [Halomicroarcula]MBX0347310.1 oligosaccharide flippase family protein [Halomicroarcula pellucida]MDS0276815.1 oligosaccharide flippase family protein [Halomicroarcula sp. S1AR25-4]GGN88040.1 polysaccharide biosynthesis protein [Halomicroarcula pellucida]